MFIPDGMPKGTPIARLTAERYANLVRYLVDGEPRTVKQYAELLKCQPQVVRRVIDEMHFVSRTRKRLVRIAGWMDVGNSLAPRWAPLYTWGDGPDAARPHKKTHAESCREYRARVKARKMTTEANAFLYKGVQHEN